MTMDQIAAKTGVSTNAISRALKNKPDISPTTRKAIKQIAFEMGYTRFQSGSSVTDKKNLTYTVGLVIADNSNPVYSFFVKGAEGARILLSHIRRQTGIQQIILPTELIVRTSTAKLIKD